MSQLSRYHTFHAAQDTILHERLELMEYHQAVAYAAEQGPVDDDEAVTDYRDRRGK